MKKSLVILYLLFQLITVKAQYPNALPSSGTINMLQIYNWMLAAGEVSTGPNSISNLNSYSHLTDKTAPYTLSDWYGYALPAFSCGNNFTVRHTAGTTSPITKNVTYGTVTSSLSGATKCWITQNLGADQQATSATDATDASAGWYWQFNRMNGYATGTIPAWVTIAISQNVNWFAANDPCTILLGTGWRIPTYNEWLIVDTSWGNYNDAYNSVLKIHAAGYLSVGVLTGRGTYGFYWSSTQFSLTSGRMLNTNITVSAMATNTKILGNPVRCIKD